VHLVGFVIRTHCSLRTNEYYTVASNTYLNTCVLFLLKTTIWANVLASCVNLVLVQPAGLRHGSHYSVQMGVSIWY